MSLAKLESFGNVAAEDDAILDYFLSTEALAAVEKGDVLVVLGRKGTGKTAIVRYLTAKQDEKARSLNLREYPWQVHAARVDHGATVSEAYVAAWRYLLAVIIASMTLKQRGAYIQPSAIPLNNFLNDNYGGLSPDLADILTPTRLRLGKLSFAPSVAGVSLGGIELDRQGNDLQFGLELAALTNSIIDKSIECLKACKAGPISLHFDELDQGISTLDEQRREMLIGLVLAARSLKRRAADAGVSILPVIYLRTDLWNELQFSDKNKITQASSMLLEWTPKSLLDLVNLRLRAKLGDGVTWDEIAEQDKMRGRQPKWSHILSRTFLRPRDVISFLNQALLFAKKRDAAVEKFNNEDIAGARDGYSVYLKAELDDEIMPHWKGWGEALQACSAIGTLSFQRNEFGVEYGNRKTKENPVTAEEALELLYRFSVVGYRIARGGGGSAWVFQYTHPNAGYDSVATQLKVHAGLKEFARLSEERSSGRGSSDVAFKLDVDPEMQAIVEKYLSGDLDVEN